MAKRNEAIEKTEAPDVEAAVAAQAEVEDLFAVDLGINDTLSLNIFASERLQMAIAYQRLYIRALTVRASVKANQSVGNSEGIKQFENQLKILELDIAHALRGIKQIDDACPKAKRHMKEIKVIDG